MARQHQDPCLELRIERQRHVHSHLIAVKVGVERRTHHRVNADGLAFDQDRLERLDAETVQRWSAVQQNRMPVDDVLKNLPHLGALLVHHFLCALHRLHDTTFDQFADDERFKELDGHVFREAAFVQLQLGSHHDHRTAGIIHTLAEQVLAEPSLLPFQHIGEGFQRTVVVAPDRIDAAGIIEERINGLLQHPLFVPEDHVRRLDIDQPFQPVVADDHPAVEIIQIRGGESPAFEGHKRTKFRRNHRDDIEHHPFRLVQRRPLAFAEGLNHAQAFQGFLLLLH